MATGVQNAWSTTPATNATADSAVYTAEGWAPSVVNDGIRAMMALIKKWVKDWQGSLVTGGSSTAYTLATNETLALADGVAVTCRMSATNGAAPTLNVDSTGAVAIQSAQGTAVPTGALVSGAIYKFTYYASSAAWIVNGLFDATGQVSAATTSLAGKAELATDAEAIAKADTARVMTPSNLAALGSSDTFAGLIELATDAETTTGTATDRALTPANLRSQIATQSEQETGTSTTKLVTSGRQHFHASAAKVWGIFDFAGNIDASYNVTSITDQATGRILVTIATDFSSAAYAVLATVIENSARSLTVRDTIAAGSFQVDVIVPATAVAADGTKLCVAAFGDFA